MPSKLFIQMVTDTKSPHPKYIGVNSPFEKFILTNCFGINQGYIFHLHNNPPFKLMDSSLPKASSFHFLKFLPLLVVHIIIQVWIIVMVLCAYVLAIAIHPILVAAT